MRTPVAHSKAIRAPPMVPVSSQPRKRGRTIDSHAHSVAVRETS
jgi:hypothetical protein